MEVVGTYRRFGPGDVERNCAECGLAVFTAPNLAPGSRVVCANHSGDSDRLRMFQ